VTVQATIELNCLKMKLQDVTSHSKCFLNRLLPTIVVIKVNSRMQIVIYATSE
jgi:hypothetical protein